MMRIVGQIVLFMLLLPFASLLDEPSKIEYEDEDEGAEHLSWSLGTPDNIPPTVVILDQPEEELDDY